jgi:cytoskeletal protein RodZ
MNIKSVLVFLICTIAIHIALIKVNEIVLENKEMKQNNDKEAKEEVKEEETTDKEEEDKIKEIPAVSNNKIATDDPDVINDEDLRSDLLNFIKKSKNNTTTIFSKDSEIELEKNNTNVQEEPGYLNFGEDIERELKTTEYNLKTASGDSDNITLRNSTGNNVDESAANKEFKMIQNAGWKYKNEGVMNGGVDDGIGGFDPKAICNFAAL